MHYSASSISTWIGDDVLQVVNMTDGERRGRPYRTWQRLEKLSARRRTWLARTTSVIREEKKEKMLLVGTKLFSSFHDVRTSKWNKQKQSGNLFSCHISAETFYYQIVEKWEWVHKSLDSATEGESVAWGFFMFPPVAHSTTTTTRTMCIYVGRIQQELEWKTIKKCKSSRFLSSSSSSSFGEPPFSPRRFPRDTWDVNRSRSLGGKERRGRSGGEFSARLGAVGGREGVCACLSLLLPPTYLPLSLSLSPDKRHLTATRTPQSFWNDSNGVAALSPPDAPLKPKEKRETERNLNSATGPSTHHCAWSISLCFHCARVLRKRSERGQPARPSYSVVCGR